MSMVNNYVIGNVDALGLEPWYCWFWRDKCSLNQIRIDSAEVKILPRVWEPTDTSVDSLDVLSGTSTVLSGAGTATGVGVVAGPVVGVSVAIIEQAISAFGLDPSLIAQAVYSQQVRASGRMSGFRIWTKVKYRTCRTERVFFDCCERLNWDITQGDNWEMCTIGAELGTPGDYWYQGYDFTVKHATQCISLHLSRFQ